MEREMTCRSSIRSTAPMEGELSLDGKASLSVGVPPEFGGTGENTTPEELQVAALASCYLMTVQFSVQRMDLGVKSIDVSAEGDLEKGSAGWEFTEFRIKAEATLAENQDRDQAETVFNQAKDQCIVSRGLKPEINLEVKLD